MASKKAEIKTNVVSERASILFKCIAVGQEATNITNMLFMKKGDVYMDYCDKFPKTKGKNPQPIVDYPILRSAIEIDLSEAPKQEVERITIVKGVKTPKKITIYPWGEMSIKMKAHSLAVSILKTFQRRSIKFEKDAIKVEGVTLFKKYDKEKKEAEVVIMDVYKKTIHKVYDEKRALDFLNSFLKK